MKDSDYVICGYVQKAGSVTSIVLGQYNSNRLDLRQQLLGFAFYKKRYAQVCNAFRNIEHCQTVASMV